FARIETNSNDVKFFSNLKRQDAKRRDHAVENLRAEHRAIVIDERENDGLLSEILAEFYFLPTFIAKDEIERQLLIELLFETDFTQRFRQTGRGISGFGPRAVER